MKIFEIIKLLGIPSNDAKQRFKNKQIKVNGEPVDMNMELSILPESSMLLGEFVYDMFSIIGYSALVQLFGKDLPHLFDDECKEFYKNSKAAQYMSNWICISISKNDHRVFKKI